MSFIVFSILILWYIWRQILTTCKVTNWSHKQKSHQYGDPTILDREWGRSDCGISVRNVCIISFNTHYFFNSFLSAPSGAVRRWQESSFWLCCCFWGHLEGQSLTQGVMVSTSAFLASVYHQCGFKPWLGLEFSGFSMRHFLKHVVRVFLGTPVSFPPSSFNGWANKIKLN